MTFYLAIRVGMLLVVLTRFQGNWGPRSLGFFWELWLSLLVNLPICCGILLVLLPSSVNLETMHPRIMSWDVVSLLKCVIFVEYTCVF